MDFKKHIQNKYQREINPEFSNSAWQSFLQYREKKKRRPILILWIAIGSILAVILMTYFVSSNRYQKHSIPTSIKSADTSRIQALTKEPGNHPGPLMENKSESGLNYKTGFSSAQKAANKRPKSLLALTHAQTNNNIDQEKTGTEDFLSRSKSTATTNSQKLPVIKKVEFLQPRPSVELYSERIRPVFDSQIQESSRISTEMYRWEKSTFDGQVYGGLAFPSHVQTVEEKAFQIGAKFYSNTRPKIRLKTGLELGSISFISKIMNPQLGVDFIEAPNHSVRFDHAIVESVSINLDLGMDFLLFSKKNWETYAGLSYQLSKEIVKDIDYSFEGNDDLSTNDDILIAKKNSAKYFVPHILKLESGIRYKTPIGGINLSFTYPYQLSKTNIDLLRQFQLNFGFFQKL